MKRSSNLALREPLCSQSAGSFSPEPGKTGGDDGGDPGKSVLAVGLMTQNQIVSLESVTRLFSELQTERNWIEKEMDKVFREKVLLTTELKDVDRAIDELKHKKADLETRLQKTTHAEKELRTKMERVDTKVASIGEESARFERSIRHITVPEPPGAAKEIGASQQASSDSSLRTLRGHMDAVAGLDLDLAQSVVLSGSSDKSMKVWSLANGACLQTVWGHTGAVKCVALKGGRLLSGSQDHSLRLWNASNGRCLSILRGHSGAVSCAQLDDVRIVSGGFDRNLSVWDPDLGSCVSILSGHADVVTALQFWDFGLASASADRTVRMWDLRSGACHRTIEAHQGGVAALQFDTTKLITGGADNSVKVWDLRMGEALQVLPFRAAITALSFDASSLVVASADAILKVFDCFTYQQKRVLTGHTGSVLSLKVQDNQLITGATDNVIKVWQL